MLRALQAQTRLNTGMSVRHESSARRAGAGWTGLLRVAERQQQRGTAGSGQADKIRRQKAKKKKCFYEV